MGKISKYNKTRCAIVGGIIITLTVLLGIGLVKFNSNEVVAYVNERNKLLEGMTITDLVLKESNEIKKGPSKSYGKVVYITIDDGPSQYTNKIINILNKNNVKATFFMIEGRMKEYKNEVKNIVKNGNSAGFHSVTHDVNKLYINNDSAKKEFDTNQDTFESITGEKSYLIRLPFGSKPYTPRGSYENLVKAGYKLWDWNIDTEDWKSTSTQIISNVKKFSNNKENIVLLMHEKKQSVAALDEMIKYLKQEGYEFLAIKANEEEKNYWIGNLSSNEN